MANAQANEAADAAGAEADGAPAKPRKRTLLAIAAAAVLLIGGGAGVYFSGILGGDAHQSDAGGGEAARPPVFYPLPEMIVTLNTGERKSTFLKVKLNLELSDQGHVSKLDPLLPRVTDTCQVFLRDLRLDDLQGSAGTARLRTELLRRISLALAPIPVNDVLVAELMIN